MRNKGDNIKSQRVFEAKKRIKSGWYDDFGGDIEKAICFSERERARSLLRQLNLPYFGDPDPYKYKKTAFESCKTIFGDVTKTKKARHDFSPDFENIDIELPFRIDTLHEQPIWKAWYDRYNIRSILIKIDADQTKKVNCKDVAKTQKAVSLAKRGGFAIIFSRIGFEKDAIIELRYYTENSNGLILPIDHNGLKKLLKLSTDGTSVAMEYLSDQETDLLQVA